MLQQGILIGAIIRVTADADAPGDEQFLPCQLKGLGQTAQQLIGNRGNIIGQCNFIQQDPEFISPQPRHGVPFPNNADKAPRYLFEQLVAGRMAQRIVDALEAVDINV